MTVQPEKPLTSEHCLRSLWQHERFAGVVQGRGHCSHPGTSGPGPLGMGTAARGIVLASGEDERLLAQGSPACTCDIVLLAGTMLMDWREFRGEPGT